MDSTFLTSLADDYQWKLSLIAFVGIMASSFVGKYLYMLVPTFREAAAMNRADFAEKMSRPAYAENQAWNRKWGLFDQFVIFACIIPFCITAQAQPVWQMLLDMFVILMVYDFFYYLVHRFLFHDGGWFPGPLMWVHAVHHRQHNPCRWDGSYIHPIEVAMGLGLYAAVTLGLSFVMGDFHYLTIIITWVAFSEINQHNHDLWKADRFPYKYLKYMSDMHHHHHARFTGGNFATISLLYDWMFGTMDYGDAPRKAAIIRPAKN